MAATVINTLTAYEIATLEKYFGDIERTPYGRQLTSYLLQLSKKYGVYGGSNGGNYAGLAGVSFDPTQSPPTLSFNAADGTANDQMPFLN